LILAASLIFAILILALKKAEPLAAGIASFFFSLWSLRGILDPQIRTFPTLIDYWFVLLCSFLLTGLLWRLLTRRPSQEE
jgi:hypothetical protein